MKNVKQVTQAYSQVPWRRELQVIIWFLLILVAVALVAGVYLNITARAVTSGSNIQKMQNDIETLQRTNTDLETTLAELRSIDVMEKRAKDMGFEVPDPGRVSYFEVPGYMARHEVVLAPTRVQAVAPAVVMPRVYTESLVDWFKDNILSAIEFSGGTQP
jgi:cell division protein FtsL